MSMAGFAAIPNSSGFDRAMAIPPNRNQAEHFQQAVQQAIAAAAPLTIIGGGTKRFYGGEGRGEPLSTLGHVGVVEYEPTELVVTVRSGTRLADLEDLLAEQGQMLPFEPPRFGQGSTIGGAVACGLSGPRRPYAGAVRDHVLGVRFVNGLGQVLSMGGQVMKNVAGFDVSRLMAGSLGTLGLLLDISLRVMPMPELEETVVLEVDSACALARMSALAAKCLPITAMSHAEGLMHVRVSGDEAAVSRASADLGGSALREGRAFWDDLKNQRLPWFQDKPLWRLSVPPATAQPDWLGACWMDWGGAQRWVAGDCAADRVFAWAGKAKGHATLFRSPMAARQVFQPLPAPLLQLNRRIKRAFDPHGIFRSRSLYPDD